MRTFFIASLVIVASGLAACAHDSPPSPSTPAAGPAAPLPDGPTVALQHVDAPGFNVGDLTARVRDGLVWGSGVVVVDQLAVRAEIAACVEMPCPEVQQERFKQASLVANASLAMVGSQVLGTLRISRGLKEVARVNAQGSDAAAIATRLGREGGAALRAAILATATSASTAPDTAER
jgi:hypothetical protein